MSKSLGNGIDPLEIIDKYGADALRFSLILGTSPGNDIRYSEEKLEAAGNFANKVWNASKFVLMNLEQIDEIDNNIENAKAEDKWIVERLNAVTKEIIYNLDNFDFGVALQKVYDFIWDEFCDWYIEMVKPRLYNKEDPSRGAAGYILDKVLEESLKLLHPFMPFVTEKIYTQLLEAEETIMLAKFPHCSPYLYFEKETKQIEEIKQVITGIRNVRTTMNVHPAKKSKLIFVTKECKEIILESEAFIKKLGFGDEIVVQENKDNIPQNAVSVVTPNIELYMPFEDLVDIQEEIERLEKEKSKIEIEKSKTEVMLSNQGFISKAPEVKVAEEKEKLAKFNEMIKTIEERIRDVSKC